MAVRNVNMCPKCGNISFEYGDGFCSKCDSELIKTKYTEIFWNKIDENEKSEYFQKICSEYNNKTLDSSSELTIDMKEKYHDLFEKVERELHEEKPVFSLSGNRGRYIKIYEDKVEITTGITFGSLITMNATDGCKTIYFKDVIGVQFKKTGLTLGYLQFETASPLQNNITSNFFNENTYTFDKDNEFMEGVYNYVISRMNKIKRS